MLNDQSQLSQHVVCPRTKTCTAAANNQITRIRFSIYKFSFWCPSVHLIKCNQIICVMAPKGGCANVMLSLKEPLLQSQPIEAVTHEQQQILLIIWSH